MTSPATGEPMLTETNDNVTHHPAMRHHLFELGKRSKKES
jgi:hypothetical protein